MSRIKRIAILQLETGKMDGWHCQDVDIVLSILSQWNKIYPQYTHVLITTVACNFDIRGKIKLELPH